MKNQARNEIGSSRMDTVLKMLLIAFISLLAFSSGVYFGKQLSDSDYQLKALESDFSHSTEKVAHGAAPKAESHDEQIAEEEVAALSEKYVSNEKEEIAGRNVASSDAHGAPAAKADAHGAPVAKADAHAAPAAKAQAKASAHDHDDDDHAAPAHGAPVAKVGKPDLSAAHQAAARVANNNAPAAAAAIAKPSTETRVPNSLPRTVGVSQDVEFTVQVASYPTMDQAKEQAAELVRKGFPAFPVEATVAGKTWYRVSVGSFKTQKEATAYRGQLLKQASLPSAIVQRIQR